MDYQLQRDLGRVEATVEIVKEDVKDIKTDLTAIKEQLSNMKAVKVSDWKRVSAVAVIASLATTVFNWVRPFIA